MISLTNIVSHEKDTHKYSKMTPAASFNKLNTHNFNWHPRQ